MKIVVVGGTGLIGKKMQPLLEQAGHQVVAAAPSNGVNAVTGEGLAQALQGADVVVDVSNSPSFEAQAVMDFFQASTRNLLAAERAAGVRHHVALSIVGADRVADSPYLRAKAAQEALIAQGGVPYTIVRATQFYEFLAAIAQSSIVEGKVRATSRKMQPMAADDVAKAVVEAAISAPIGGMREVGGPQALGLDELLRRALAAKGDATEVVTDDAARYFGALIDDRSLTTGAGAKLGEVTLDAWLKANA